jgi:hypothetical protein
MEEITYQADNQNFDHLIDMQIIKVDVFTGIIVPYHDIYKHIYVTTYTRPSNFFKNQRHEDTLIHQLLTTSKNEDRKRAANEIIKMRYTKFGTVLYILESIFYGLENRQLKLELGEELYYDLFYTYGYACANASSTISGKDIFEQIYSEIKTSKNINLKKMALKVLYEIINSCYDGMLYNEINTRIRDFELLLDQIIYFSDIYACRDDCLSYRLVEHIKFYLRVDNGESYQIYFENLKQKLLNSDRLGEYMDLLWRYAHRLYSIDIELAYQYTIEAKELANLLKDEKHMKILDFQSTYISLIKDNNFTLMRNLETKLNALKFDLNSHYIRNSFALAAVYYMKGDILNGNALFLAHIKNKRKLRKRLLGYFYQNLALIEIHNNNYVGAINALEQAKVCFDARQSYIDYVDHNIRILQKGDFSYNKIMFLTSYKLEVDIFYVDPRADS